MVNKDETTRVNPINFSREMQSALKAKMNNPTAIPTVDTETARLLITGVI